MGTQWEVALGAWEEAKTQMFTLGRLNTRQATTSEAWFKVECGNDSKTKREKLATSLGVN